MSRILAIKAECTGCGACENICPQRAIVMGYDQTGFLMPHINRDLCTACGMCDRVCPVMQEVTNIKNLDPPIAYACWLKDEKTLRKSTSGGVFTVLADYVLRQKGIVFGCVMGHDLSARHVAASSEAEIEEMRGSKYIQSEIRDTYRIVKKNLRQGRPVLFAGCPCQVAGLYGYLQNERVDRLLTVDLVCHGIASKIFFDQYIAGKEEKYQSPVTSVEFRSKKRGWKRFTVCLTFQNGREVYIPSNKDGFMRCYYQRAIYRESCYTCPFARIPRIGDFTIGDYSGVPKNITGKKAFQNGISLFLVNNEKARYIFEEIKYKLVCHERPLEEAVRTNSNLSEPSRKHPDRSQIFDSSCGVEEIADRYCRVTWKARIASLIGSDRLSFIRKMKGKME